LLDLGREYCSAVMKAILTLTSPKTAQSLHVAAWKAWHKTVKLLIERGAPITAEDAKGRTALMLAVKACVDLTGQTGVARNRGSTD